MIMRFTWILVVLLALGCTLAIAKPSSPYPAIAKHHPRVPKLDIHEEKYNHRMMQTEAKKTGIPAKPMQDDSDVRDRLIAFACSEDVEMMVKENIEGKPLPNTEYGDFEFKNKVIENITYPLESCSVTIVEESEINDFKFHVTGVVVTVDVNVINTRRNRESTIKLEVEADVENEGIHVVEEDTVHVTSCAVTWNHIRVLQVNGADLPNSNAVDIDEENTSTAGLIALEYYLCYIPGCIGAPA